MNKDVHASSRYQELLADSPRWVSALALELSKARSNDVYTAYQNVAHAFPSPRPNPRSFDDPLIDEPAFRRWAAALGWEHIATIPNGYDYPAIRFARWLQA